MESPRKPEVRILLQRMPDTLDGGLSKLAERRSMSKSALVRDPMPELVDRKLLAVDFPLDHSSLWQTTGRVPDSSQIVVGAMGTILGRRRIPFKDNATESETDSSSLFLDRIDHTRRSGGTCFAAHNYRSSYKGSEGPVACSHMKATSSPSKRKIKTS